MLAVDSHRQHVFYRVEDLIGKYYSIFYTRCSTLNLYPVMLKVNVKLTCNISNSNDITSCDLP